MNPAEYDEQNFPGLENRLIRYYFYLNSGLNVLNQFRNLFLVIFAAYFALKLDNYWLLVAMFVPSLLVLAVIGYYSVHRVNRITEWLTTRFGTTYGIKQYNIQQGILQELREIRDKLP